MKVCERIGGDSHQKRLTLKWLSHPPVGGRGCLLLVPSKEVFKSSLSQMQSPSLGVTLPCGPLFLRHVSFFPLTFFHFFSFPPHFIAHEKNEPDGAQTCSAWSSALTQSLCSYADEAHPHPRPPLTPGGRLGSYLQPIILPGRDVFPRFGLIIIIKKKTFKKYNKQLYGNAVVSINNTMAACL